MSERPTPETDAVAAHEGNWDTKALRMTAHARKLERERDELMAYLDAAHYANCNAELRRERDEAWEDAAAWKKVALREASINGARLCKEEAAK